MILFKLEFGEVIYMNFLNKYSTEFMLYQLFLQYDLYKSMPAIIYHGSTYPDLDKCPSYNIYFNMMAASELVCPSWGMPQCCLVKDRITNYVTRWRASLLIQKLVMYAAERENPTLSIQI